MRLFQGFLYLIVFCCMPFIAATRAEGGFVYSCVANPILLLLYCYDNVCYLFSVIPDMVIIKTSGKNNQCSNTRWGCITLYLVANEAGETYQHYCGVTAMWIGWV